MNKIINGEEKRIFVNTTKFKGITDMFLKIISLPTGNTIIDKKLFTEINSGVYYCDIIINENGYYLLEVISENISTESLKNVIEVVPYDKINKIEEVSDKTRKMSTNKAVISDDGLLVTIYDDDGETVLHKFNVSVNQKIREPIN